MTRFLITTEKWGGGGGAMRRGQRTRGPNDTGAQRGGGSKGRGPKETGAQRDGGPVTHFLIATEKWGGGGGGRQ